MIMQKRSFCPAPIKSLEVAKPHKTKHKKQAKKGELAQAEQDYEEHKSKVGFPSGGYLIGRHPEVDYPVNIPTISNRHCLFFPETRDGDTIAVLEDLSSNGTLVNDQMLGRNKRRELEDGDEITLLDEARFIFRYPRNQDATKFHSQYRILQQLGKGISQQSICASTDRPASSMQSRSSRSAWANRNDHRLRAYSKRLLC